QGPNKVIHRYKRILCTYKETKIMTKALCRHKLERNTVVSTALIAQLAIAAPEKYKELAASHSEKERLLDFSKRCLEAMDVETKERVHQMKADRKLLPLGKSKKHQDFQN
ncbi:coiled-coil domain-containing protein 106-like, partial [Huso huso]